MTRFQLVFRDGNGDRSEFRYNNGAANRTSTGNSLLRARRISFAVSNGYSAVKGCAKSLKTCRGSSARSLPSRCPPSGDGSGQRGTVRPRTVANPATPPTELVRQRTT